jgi:peptide/nickel transport system substrate-binding protein
MLRVNRTTFGNYLKYADLNSCEVVDDTTLKIHLTKPYPIFLVDATTAAYFIMSPDSVKGHATSDDPEALKWMSDHACGTGPFKLVEWTQGQRLVFETFVDYWGGSKGGRTTPKVDRVIYKIVEDPSTARLMLEKGDVDIAEKLTVEQFEKLKTTAGIRVVNFKIPKIVYITMDVSNPPFDDMKVRQAISHAINYEEIIEYIERKNVTRMHGLIPEGIMAHNPGLPLYPFDLSRAKELMRASAYPNGITTDLIFALERRPEFEQVGTYIQAYLKRIGINVRIQKIAFDTQIAKMEKGNYGLSLMTWTCVMPDPDDVAGWLYDSARASGGWNGSYWPDKEVQAKLSKAREIADQDERKALYQEVDRKAVDEAIYVYLYQLTNQFAMRENVENFYYDSFMKCYFWATEKD